MSPLRRCNDWLYYALSAISAASKASTAASLSKSMTSNAIPVRRPMLAHSSCSPYSRSMGEPMKPDTIVLIHGFWVTPRSWEHWKPYYEQQGYRALTPAHPGFKVRWRPSTPTPTPIEKEPHGRMGSMPETTPLPPFLSLTHFLDGQTFVNALPRDARRAGVRVRCPLA